MTEPHLTLRRLSFYGAMLLMCVLLIGWLVTTDRDATRAAILVALGVVISSVGLGRRALQAVPSAGFGWDVVVCGIGIALSTGGAVWVFQLVDGALPTERLLSMLVWSLAWGQCWPFLRPPHRPVPPAVAKRESSRDSTGS